MSRRLSAAILATPCGRPLTATSPLIMGFFLLVIVAAACPVTTIADQPKPSTGAEAVPDFAALQQESRKQIVRLKGEITAIQSSQASVPVFLTQELDLWQQFELVTQERRAIQEDLEDCRSTQTTDPFGEGLRQLPSSYLEFDDLRGLVALRHQNLELLELELQSEKMLTREARVAFESSEQQRRRIQEEIEESVPANKLDQRRQESVAKLESRVLEARLNLHRDQASLLTIRIEAAESEISVCQSVLASSAGKHRLTQAELDQQIAFIDDRQHEIRVQLAAIDARMRAGLRGRATTTDTSIDSAYEMAREEVQLLRQLLSGAGQLKECWRRRYLLSSGQASANEIELWLQEAEQTKQRIAQLLHKLQLRTRQRQESLALLHRSSSPSNGAAIVADAEAKRLELERIIAFYGNVQVLVTTGERICEFMVEDLGAKQSHFSLADNLNLAKNWIASAWQYEITTIDDEPITIKKIICGFALLLCGFFISRLIASVVAFRMLPRLGVTESAAAVLRTILFYLLLIGLVFVSLAVVNVPLTIFAFLGGAVAIGVGFGSQNLINNFISGLILLVERPIRLSDLVNVDGIDATVEHIGARSTRVRTGTNLEIMVPNSKFLENNVTNWTLSDTRIRTSVSVGVAYGSPVREVIDLLHQVIRGTDAALSTPEPIVLFQDFGDNSLGFEVHFWVHMRRIMDGAKVRSDVRVAIDDAFREEGIVIAYPQRDVHIDMQSPIEVRMADEDGLARRSSPRREQRQAA